MERNYLTERKAMKCIQCGKEFEADRSTAKYCSVSCKLKYLRKSDTVRNVDDTVTPDDPCMVATVRKDREGEIFLDVEKDLKLDLGKDLGLTSWTDKGAFMRADITIAQVRRFRRLVEARHGWEPRAYV